MQAFLAAAGPAKTAPALPCGHPARPAGLLYTSMPRAEIAGVAEFRDEANGLHAAISFGRVEGAASPLLRRSDALSGTLYEDISGAVARKLRQAGKVRRGAVRRRAGRGPRRPVGRGWRTGI